MTGWQPIETAPLDEPVIVYVPVKRLRVCVAIKRGAWSWASMPGLYAIEPTHWMPLPEPPVQVMYD